MFIRPYFRTINGKRRAYWALVESYRTERGPRQRVVAHLGTLDKAGRLGLKQAAEDGPRSAQKKLFPEPEPEWVEVDASTVRVENCRQFGGPWLALELIKTLGLDAFLRETIPSGREDVPWSVMALVLVIARLCDPSSELSIAENFFRKTALSDLLISFTKNVAVTYGSQGIRANVICPGTIDTERGGAYWDQKAGGKEKLLKWYPLGRLGRPDDVANLALYLASDESSFVTGATMVIDGGLTAGSQLFGNL